MHVERRRLIGGIDVNGLVPLTGRSITGPLKLRGVADGGRVLHASVINHASANSAVEQ